jgi:hypothetical protein
LVRAAAADRARRGELACLARGTDAESGVTIPSYEALSAAFGLPYRRVETVAALDAFLAAYDPSGPPIVIDVMIGRSEPRGPSVKTIVHPDGRLFDDDLRHAREPRPQALPQLQLPHVLHRQLLFMAITLSHLEVPRLLSLRLWSELQTDRPQQAPSQLLQLAELERWRHTLSRARRDFSPDNKL